MKKMLMFVYNDLNTDARVLRAAETISEIVNLDVLSVGDVYTNNKYKTINIESSADSNIIRYFDVFIKMTKWIKGRKYDILYAHDFSSALPALYMKFFKKCDKIIYDAHELFIPQKGMFFPLRDRFFYSLEKEIIKRSDVVICAQEKRGELMVEHYKLKLKPITIRNISKLPQTDAQLETELQEKCNEFFGKPGITIVYAGALVADRKLDELIKSVEQLGDEYKLLIVGDGSDKVRLQDIANNSSSLTFCFLGNVPYIHLSKILNRCDVGYLYYPVDILNNIYCASNKVYEYASIGLPIVANLNPTIQDIFNEWDIGICSNNFKTAIETITSDINRYRDNCVYFDIRNSWDNESNMLLEVVKSIL